MTENSTKLAPLSEPFGEAPPKVGPPPASFEPAYMDGTCGPYPGVNPGRDQDRSRIDECTPASYSYGGSVASSASDSDIDAGY